MLLELSNLLETWSNQLLYFSFVSVVGGRPNKNFPNQYKLSNFDRGVFRVVIAWVCVTVKVVLELVASVLDHAGSVFRVKMSSVF
jgi:hypothetical protein